MERTVPLVLFASSIKKKKDDIVLIEMNMHWETRNVEMPQLPDDFKWKLEMSTGEDSSLTKKEILGQLT